MSIPRVAEDLTPEWLSDTLGREITGVRIEPVGVGVGLVGSLFRLHLEGEGEPNTIIAKLSARGPALSAEAWAACTWPLLAGMYSDTLGFQRADNEALSVQLFKYLLREHASGDLSRERKKCPVGGSMGKLASEKRMRALLARRWMPIGLKTPSVVPG